MSIRKRETKKGTVYDVMYRAPNGKQISVKVPNGVDPKLYEQQILSGTLKRSSSSYTVSEMLDDYLRIYRSQVKQSTYQKFAYTGGVLKDAIGHKVVGGIKPAQVQEWIIDWTANKAPKTVKLAYLGLLTRAADLAQQHEHITENPFAKKYIWPKAQTENFEGTALDVSQAREYLSRAKAEGDQYYAFAFIALHTAMRRGEILAMHTDHLSTESRTYDVRHTLQSDNQLTTPKTQSSSATVPLSQKTVDVIVALGISDGRLISLSLGEVQGAHDRIRTAMGMPNLRIHDLRHTCASLMCLAGVPIAVVSRQLRHANVSMTWDIYAHLYPQQEHDGCDKVEEVLG